MNFFINILIAFFIFLIIKPAYSLDYSQKSIDNYMNKISNKFSSTFCNTYNFGISQDGALKFAIGETNKEFFKKKINQYIDYEFIDKKIRIDIKNKCSINDLDNQFLTKLDFN